jgi:hypothetical protein
MGRERKRMLDTCFGKEAGQKPQTVKEYCALIMANDMKVRGMQFWKAAMRYYPDFSRSTAVRRFREEIHNTPELLEELKRLGYDEHRRYFPPRQMAVIIKYLGD